MDIAPNGRVDLGYQAQVAVNPATYGTGNASIDSWHVSKAAAASAFSAPTKVSSVFDRPSGVGAEQPRAPVHGRLQPPRLDERSRVVHYTDTRSGDGCPAVDAYQHAVDGTSAIRGDMRDRIATGLGLDPYADDPSIKPAPPLVCPHDFGDSDAYVSVVTP